MWHVGNCGVRVVGKMSKDIGMESVKVATVVSFIHLVWLLFDDSISIYACSFF